ncbi:MAG: GyrI-like domain-containing protein [Oscillospiraceae bacterium]|nr:GyrI-like domain-containing protein [Oscillospiraceae bacterium]
MEFISMKKTAFSVIGREGSTRDGEGFIARLWQEANGRFSEIAHLAKMQNSSPAGIWGAMTDFSRSFRPWENNFSEGLYLAGVECEAGAQPSEGWTKWTIPGFEYRCIDASVPFPEALTAFLAEGYTLAGAVQEFTDPAAGRSWLCFPARKL